MTLSTLLMGVGAKLAIDVNNHLNRKLAHTRERNEVTHALNIIARSIRSSGFPAASSQFPKIRSSQTFNIKKNVSIGKSSSLDTTKIGTFSFRKGINNLNQSDAIAISHASIAQFDCLGHRITNKRLINGYAHQGFFTQRVDGPNAKTGMLMCQSLDNRGRAQNDGILSGIQKLQFDLLPNERDVSGILVSLTMDSGKKYERFIAIRHQDNSN